jgi:hypothetical protein
LFQIEAAGILLKHGIAEAKDHLICIIKNESAPMEDRTRAIVSFEHNSNANIMDLLLPYLESKHEEIVLGTMRALSGRQYPSLSLLNTLLAYITHTNEKVVYYALQTLRSFTVEYPLTEEWIDRLLSAVLSTPVTTNNTLLTIWILGWTHNSKAIQPLIDIANKHANKLDMVLEVLGTFPVDQETTLVTSITQGDHIVEPMSLYDFRLNALIWLRKGKPIGYNSHQVNYYRAKSIFSRKKLSKK